MGINATPVLVPKTTPHVDDLFATDEDQIGLAGKFSPMEPETKTHAVHQTAHCKLGLHPLAPDAAHILAATLPGNGVHKKLRR